MPPSSFDRAGSSSICIGAVLPQPGCELAIATAIAVGAPSLRDSRDPGSRRARSDRPRDGVRRCADALAHRNRVGPGEEPGDHVAALGRRGFLDQFGEGLRDARGVRIAQRSTVPVARNTAHHLTRPLTVGAFPIGLDVTGNLGPGQAAFLLDALLQRSERVGDRGQRRAIKTEVDEAQRRPRRHQPPAR